MKIIHAPKLPNFTRNEDGFTLIELMTVVAILGILTAIAVPVYLKPREVVNTAVLKTDLGSLSMALVQDYRNVQGQQDNPVTREDFPDILIAKETSWNVVGNENHFCISAWNNIHPELVYLFESTTGLCSDFGKQGELLRK